MKSTCFSALFLWNPNEIWGTLASQQACVAQTGTLLTSQKDVVYFRKQVKLVF